ncbi:GNAT family N-acetyltransferase [Aquibacillus halophilus]|uniref:GNAT family N-acetyltransferase n=1 Tax=Aquibacillus halophilus TaxID=930132 RepID=A0A6A8DFM2_9BACI|nr:GNAT family N-acetyltransferase [Aquibacillus halophilus]MRH44508.1 GNAT family N-acetyltransferase [Aquibacillus halophilus]
MRNLIRLEKVSLENRSRYIDYLLLADDSLVEVNKYIKDGDMYLIHFEDNVTGIMLFTFHPDLVVELKNIALVSKYRCIGMGKTVITESFEIYNRKGFNKMVVGTANSSIGNLIFYQKAGFRMTEIKRGFFEKYANPIFENGIKAVDMIMFEKDLTS